MLFFSCLFIILLSVHNKEILFRHRPTTTGSLLKVDGVSERQCERFGEQLVNCVATFCKENELDADIFKDQTDSVNTTDTKVIFLVL